jgi:type VI secretion system protein VasG
MEDGEGRKIDFKNTLILLTSNVGSDLIMAMCKASATPDPETIAKALRGPLLVVFPGWLLGRIVTFRSYPLSDEMIAGIVRMQLDRIAKRLLAGHGVPLQYDDSVLELIASRCTELESGARMVDAMLTNTLLPNISQALLERMLAGDPVKKVAVTVKDADFVYDVV